jgi:ABC-type transporter Mla subunit MlaD
LSARRSVTYEIRSRDPVSGLVAGAPVEFHGVEVGTVQAVELAGPRAVRILVDVKRDAPVSSSTVATITGRGLAARGFTGYVYVSLEDGDRPGAPLAPATDSPYPVIAAAPSRSASLDVSFQQLNESVQQVNALLQTVLDAQTVASLKQSLASLEQVTHTLAAQDARVGTLIANAERASTQIVPLLQTSSDAARTLQTQVLPQARSALAQLDALSTSANERLAVILRNAQEASTRLPPLLETGNDAVRSLQTQILPQAQRTLVRLDHLSTSLDETGNRIRRNPSVLLRGAGPAPLGPGEAP